MAERAADLPAGAVPWLHDLGRWIATWLPRTAYRITVHGRDRVPRTGPVVLIANHSSFVEPQVIFGLLPRRSVFLVKAELFNGPLGNALRWIGQLAVRRGTPDRGPMMTAVQVLKAGGLIGVFPEGTRGSGEVAQAEHGAAWLVRTTDAVVLPIATRGTFRPAGTSRRLRPKVDVLVGPPFRLTVQHGRSGLEKATEELREHLAGLVRELDELRK